MHRLAELIEEAAAMDIPTAAFQVVLPAPQLEVETKLQKLGAELAAERRRITAASDEEGDGATQVSFDA